MSAKPAAEAIDLGNDLIWGVAAIAAEIGQSRRRTYYLLERHSIPARKTGAIWVASRRQLRAYFFGDEAAA